MDTGILKIVNIFLMCHSPGKPLKNIRQGVESVKETRRRVLSEWHENAIEKLEVKTQARKRFITQRSGEQSLTHGQCLRRLVRQIEPRRKRLDDLGLKGPRK